MADLGDVVRSVVGPHRFAPELVDRAQLAAKSVATLGGYAAAGGGGGLEKLAGGVVKAGGTRDQGGEAPAEGLQGRRDPV